LPMSANVSIYQSRTVSIYLNVIVCSFDWYKNRIVIRIDLVITPPDSPILDFEKDFLKNLCVVITNIIRKTKDEENFMLWGYKIKGYPTEEDIKNHIMIKVDIYNDSSMKKIILSSQSDKISKEILFSE